MTDKKSTSRKDLLFSKDEKTVIKTINAIRESGTNNDLVLLAELFEKHDSDEVKKLISGLFCDLKNQASADALVRLCQTTAYKETLKMLVSSCWQSRLNYIDNFELFIDMVIHEGFEISFEAFTLIESFEEKTTETRKSDLVAYVKNNISACKDANLPFALELVTIIEDFKV